MAIYIRFLFFLFLIACFAGCSKNEAIIEGKVPDASYDKEVVYLVPLKDATKETVDSTFIHNSRFRFKIKPEKQNQVFILRVKPMLRLYMQQLLVVTEPGTTFVTLGAPSSGSGTPLNETLQQWKDKKFIYDSTYYTLRKKAIKETDETEKARLQSEADEIAKEYQAYADSLVEKNKDNAVGKFIESLPNNYSQK